MINATTNRNMMPTLQSPDAARAGEVIPISITASRIFGFMGLIIPPPRPRLCADAERSAARGRIGGKALSLSPLCALAACCWYNAVMKSLKFLLLVIALALALAADNFKKWGGALGIVESVPSRILVRGCTGGSGLHPECDPTEQEKKRRKFLRQSEGTGRILSGKNPATLTLQADKLGLKPVPKTPPRLPANFDAQAQPNRLVPPPETPRIPFSPFFKWGGAERDQVEQCRFIVDWRWHPGARRFSKRKSLHCPTLRRDSRWDIPEAAKKLDPFYFQRQKLRKQSDLRMTIRRLNPDFLPGRWLNSEQRIRRRLNRLNPKHSDFLSGQRWLNPEQRIRRRLIPIDELDKIDNTLFLRTENGVDTPE